jgi:hypothetical protein
LRIQDRSVGRDFCHGSCLECAPNRRKQRVTSRLEGIGVERE